RPRVRSPPGSLLGPLSARLPPRHNPLVTTLVARGDGRDDMPAQQHPRGAIGTHGIPPAEVRSRATGGVVIVVGPVHHGESVRALGAHFHHVLRYDHAL